ncbi:MAG: hypothetical protein DRQ55_06720 [Planctomycetota bacterium]|nr:MAG: hypothetical protein DRQ55_06720 [Planctomycetota bacterium]
MTSRSVPWPSPPEGDPRRPADAPVQRQAPRQSRRRTLTVELAGLDKKAALAIRPNVLLIIADDMGIDLVNAYGEHPDPARTPVLDLLAADGVLFRNAWVTPGCSSTRACMLTGRHPFQTGVGRALTYENTNFELDPGELSVAKTLRASGYHTAAVGKWHLAGRLLSGPQHPLLMGFEHHSGPMDNFTQIGNDTYYSFDKAVDGVMTQSRTYATTDQVNDALAYIEDFGDEPWFLWLAFNAPHGPAHAPPPELHSYHLPPSPQGNTPIYTRAMTEAMDTEIGRLLGNIRPLVLANTVVIVVGDNGTPKWGVTPPFDPEHAKGTIYEGGVNVPLIVWGRGVASGQESDALIGPTDLPATIAELASSPTGLAPESLSFTPLLAEPTLASSRTSMFTEIFSPSGFEPVHVRDERTTRTTRYKLLADLDFANGVTTPLGYQLYDLVADPFEANNLYSTTMSPGLQSAFDALLLSMQDAHPW